MNKNQKIVLASDHAGYKLKKAVQDYFANHGYQVVDLGPENDDKPVSYARQGQALARFVQKNPAYLGVGVCGTGIGISLAVNRFAGIRGARLVSLEDAVLAKKHNNANVLLFGGRQTKPKKAIKMILAFENEHFEGGRHQSRIADLDRANTRPNSPSKRSKK
ncbi:MULTISPECIES: RpiB/LacA/LacB family sugar-phosphate isomerase [unclassified Mycoplasma]|uniref:RpiB/LacA/LacB family sugar-phosphate isomerase n=1 Tax=unclassified Mycoplasma TaxID=2683645 RepID=UPI000FDD0864